jgi:cell division protein FtsB
MNEFATAINIAGYLIVGSLWIFGNLSHESTQRDLKAEINSLQAERTELKAELKGMTIGCLGGK